MSESNISNSQVVIFNLIPASSNGADDYFQNIFNINVNNLRFIPDYYKLEEITISNSQPVNDNLYILSSSLCGNSPLVSFTGRTTFPVNLSQIGTLGSLPSQVSFSLNMIGPDLYNNGGVGVGTLITPTYTAHTTLRISLSVNFLKYKK